jgi:ABC-2 type transport system permease protein
MTRLIVAELRRIAARRMVRLTVVLAFVGIALGGVAAFAWSGSLSEAEYQQRVAEAEARQVAQEAEIDACLRANGVSRDDEISDAIAEQCFRRDLVEIGRGVDDPRFHRSRLEGVLKGVSGALAVLGWALGASLVGAEFASRSMTTLLTWETRRGRVFLAKSVAVVAAMSVLALVVLTLVALAMWPSLALHGAPLEPCDPTLASLAGTVARGVALTTLASGIGFAIATIGRNTAAALGVGFAYVIVLENILGSSIERWRRWLVLGNVIVFVSGNDEGGDIPGRSVAAAGLFLSAVAVTLLAAAAGTFRTRDLA